MKANGSVYVSVVVIALAGYFSYQWWFNPQRAVKQQLATLAAVLSVPADGEHESGGLPVRAEQLRGYFAPDARVAFGPAGPNLESREAIVAAFAAWAPRPGGINVDFLDVQVALDSPSDAHAFMTVEVTGRNRQTGELSRDAREMRVRLHVHDGDWVVTEAAGTQGAGEH